MCSCVVQGLGLVLDAEGMLGTKRSKRCVCAPGPVASPIAVLLLHSMSMGMGIH